MNKQIQKFKENENIQEIYTLIKSCEAWSGFYSENTNNFVQSIKSYFENNGYISEKQKQELENILETNYYDDGSNEDAGDR